MVVFVPPSRITFAPETVPLAATTTVPDPVTDAVRLLPPTITDPLLVVNEYVPDTPPSITHPVLPEAIDDAVIALPPTVTQLSPAIELTLLPPRRAAPVPETVVVLDAPPATTAPVPEMVEDVADDPTILDPTPDRVPVNVDAATATAPVAVLIVTVLPLPPNNPPPDVLLTPVNVFPVPEMMARVLEV